MHDDLDYSIPQPYPPTDWFTEWLGRQMAHGSTFHLRSDGQILQTCPNGEVREIGHRRDFLDDIIYLAHANDAFTAKLGELEGGEETCHTVQPSDMKERSTSPTAKKCAARQFLHKIFQHFCV